MVEPGFEPFAPITRWCQQNAKPDLTEDDRIEYKVTFIPPQPSIAHTLGVGLVASLRTLASTKSATMFS